MIPAVAGGLTNSGTMPISADGGDSGDASASNYASFGGITQGAINMGGSPTVMIVAAVIVAVALFFALKK